MPYITVGKENSGKVELYYEDHGTGRPVVLIHGFPLNGHSWEKQVPVLLNAGYRVITYDRRGFGFSSQPAVGYDYDTFTEDLNFLMTKLKLRDVTLIGFSMGTGEVARYLSRYGADRVEKAVFIATLGPFLLKTTDNPEGVNQRVFDEIKKSIVVDRPAYLAHFFREFYNYDVYGGDHVSEQVLKANWNVGIRASAIGTLKCIDTWLTDFRHDLPRINIPTLLIHGDADRILPYAITALRFHAAVRNNRFVTVSNGPHNICWTHADEVNVSLLEFLRAGATAIAA